MNAEQSIEQAEAIIQTIDSKSQRMMHIEQELYKANRTLDTLRHHEMGHAVHAKDADGKKLFPNAEARKAEVDNNVAGSPESKAVAALLAEREDVEFSLKQAERHLKFHYKVIDHHTALTLSLMPSIADIQDFLFKTVKSNIADLLMDKPERVDLNEDS